MHKAVLIIFALASVAGLAAVAEPSAELTQAVEERRALMDDVVKPSAKLGADMIKGKIPFDVDKVTEAMMDISDVPETYVTLFPAGTEVHAVPDSEASPKIWEDFDRFKALARKLADTSTAAAAAAQKGEASFKAAFGDMTKVCKECHKAYRVKKKK